MELPHCDCEKKIIKNKKMKLNQKTSLENSTNLLVTNFN